MFNLQSPAEPVEIAETEFVTVQVGRHRYVGSGAARPAGPEAVTWRMRYRVRDDLELSAAGFEAQIGPLDVVRAVVAR